MIVEARLRGGPANGTDRAIPDLMREIKVAYYPAVAWRQFAAPDEITAVPYETHHYEPVRAVVYYEHRGQS